MKENNTEQRVHLLIKGKNLLWILRLKDIILNEAVGWLRAMNNKKAAPENALDLLFNCRLNEAIKAIRQAHSQCECEENWLGFSQMGARYLDEILTLHVKWCPLFSDVAVLTLSIRIRYNPQCELCSWTNNIYVDKAHCAARWICTICCRSSSRGRRWRKFDRYTAEEWRRSL